jgi:Ca2+-binding RTX toxin-like protein
MNMKSIACLGAATALGFGGLLAPTAASATTPTDSSVTFTGETTGAKPNGYSSAEFAGLKFRDMYDGNLYVEDDTPYSHGQGLVSYLHGYSGVEMRLTNPTTAISLAFGYDYAPLFDGTDQAELTLYRGGTVVDRVDVNVNANATMDQTISYSGGRLFNRATFQYVDAAGNYKDAIEIIDDISVAPLCTISGGAGNNNLNGTAGNDVICGDTGADNIAGGGGADLIYPGPGSDVVYGQAGGDTVMPSKGYDTVVGGKGADDLRGGAGRDRLSGSSGNDDLSGGLGRDYCNGGSGHDHATSCAVKRRIP